MKNASNIISIMCEPVVTLQSDDNLKKVRDAFETHQTDHIPILRGSEFLGIIHKNDFRFFIAGLLHHSDDFEINNLRLQRIHAQDIMTTSEDVISPETPVRTALKLMIEHHFQALPVVQNRILHGVVTPFDLLRTVQIEEIEVEADVRLLNGAGSSLS